MIITATTAEIPAVLDLLQQLFGIDLSTIKKDIAGFQVKQFRVVVSKPINPTETVNLDLTITP